MNINSTKALGYGSPHMPHGIKKTSEKQFPLAHRSNIWNPVPNFFLSYFPGPLGYDAVLILGFKEWLLFLEFSL